MEVLIPILGIIMVFGIPMSAIIGSYYVKVQKLKLQGGGGGGLSNADRKKVQALMAENENLRRRVENLEEIASDPDFIKISGTADESKLQKQIDFLADEIREMRKISQ